MEYPVLVTAVFMLVMSIFLETRFDLPINSCYRAAGMQHDVLQEGMFHNIWRVPPNTKPVQDSENPSAASGRDLTCLLIVPSRRGFCHYQSVGNN